MKTLRKFNLSFFIIYLVALLCLISLPATASGVRSKLSYYKMYPSSEIYLGKMPVQYINFGEPLKLNVTRFMDLRPHTNFAVNSDKPVKLKYNRKSGKLKIRVKENNFGLLDLPLTVKLPDKTQTSILTLASANQKLHRFAYNPEKKVESISVAGSFNSWDAGASPLKKTSGDTWVAEIPLSPGTHKYKIVINGNKWIPDPNNPRRSSDGYNNSIITIEKKEGSPPRLIPVSQTKNRVKLKLAGISIDSLEDVSAIFQLPDGSSKTAPYSLSGNHTIEVKTASAPGKSHLRVVVSDKNGRVSRSQRIRLSGTDEFNWHDAVIYMAMVDRFNDGNSRNTKTTNHPNVPRLGDWQGGDLQGIIKKIKSGYFDRLGINALWLSPLYQNPRQAWQEYIEPRYHFTGYHGYWPIKPRTVDSRFGNLKLVQRLVDLAHQHDIRVILDMVMNHTHKLHPYYRVNNDLYGKLKLGNGKENLRMWNKHQYTTWFDRFLPSFDFDNPKVTKLLIEDAEWWLEKTGADGFRLDAVKHIPPHFWGNLRKHIREAVGEKRNKKIYMVGESFLSRREIMKFVGPNKLDGQFDFPLYNTLLPTFAQGKSFNSLEVAVKASQKSYGHASIMSPLIGNFDKPRFMAYADGDIPDPEYDDSRELGINKPPKVNQSNAYKKLQQAMTFLVTLDGAPMIYYGDEVGLTGAGDPDNRRMMKFGKKLNRHQENTLEVTQTLIHTRLEHPALRYGSRHAAHVSKNQYVITRAYFEDRVLAAFNQADRPVQLNLNLQPDLKPDTYRCVLTGREITVKDNKTTTLKLPPHQSMLFIRQ